MKLRDNILRLAMATGMAATLVFAQAAGSQTGSPAGSTTTTDQTSTGSGHSSDATKSGKMKSDSMKGSASSSTASEHSGHVAGAAGSSASGSGGESMVSKQDRDFMMHAAMGGMAEVQLAQMVQQKGSSQEVKDYARKLEQDHTQANEKLKAIAQERQVTLPTDVGPEHQAMMSKLNGLSGAELDKAYVKSMVSDHKKDVKEFERASNRSMDTDLKTFASSTLPTLRDHLTAAQQLNSGSTRSRSAESMPSSTMPSSTPRSTPPASSSTPAPAGSPSTKPQP